MKCIQDNLCREMVCSVSPLSRTTKRVNVYCYLIKPIPEMMVNLLMEMKNSKNIYMAWVNQAMDYCAELGKGHMNVLGVVEQILNKMDPNLAPPCPIQVFKIVSLLAFYKYLFLEFLGNYQLYVEE